VPPFSFASDLDTNKATWISQQMCRRHMICRNAHICKLCLNSYTWWMRNENLVAMLFANIRCDRGMFEALDDGWRSAYLYQ
jgi:hypothetical protein